MARTLEPLIYSVSEAARVIGFGRTFTYKLVKQRRIQSIVVAGRTRIRREDLLAWIETEAREYAESDRD